MSSARKDQWFFKIPYTKYKIQATNYSYLKASIGLRAAAFLAGYMPKTMPTTAETPKAIAIPIGGIIKGQSKPKWLAIEDIPWGFRLNKNERG